MLSGKAEAGSTQCPVIVLETTGGSVESAGELVKTMLPSRVPIVVYFAPNLLLAEDEFAVETTVSLETFPKKRGFLRSQVRTLREI